MCKMTLSQWLVFFALLFKDVVSLKDVVLTIEPRVVQRLHSSTLRCSYDLEGAPLYSVKWYRGNYEFYRFTSTDSTPTKVFPFAGISVDVHNSNSTQVVLIDIEFNLSGNFTCEVTTDEPLKTGTAAQSMLVVQLPESPPKISVGRAPLDYGDILRANCTSPPSKPAAMLRFVLNNMTVARSEPLSLRKSLESQWSDLFLELVLSEFHFHRGRLTLRCIATIPDIYHEEAELELDSARDPVPERVSAFSSAGYPSTYYAIAFQILLFYVTVLVIKS